MFSSLNCLIYFFFSSTPHLQIAQECRQHGSLGQDLVAMCVNDVLAQGAEPLFFLDYFSCGSLDVDVAASVVGGVAKACEMAGCALLGERKNAVPIEMMHFKKAGADCAVLY